ncbi:MAG: xanthine dehydrogenase family protein molybdopterin-binding subunit [Solirubrobacteraceae bacterium]
MSDPGQPTAVVETIESIEQELGRWTGKSVPRKEDRRLLKGQGQFVDDAWMFRQGYVHFLRSPYGHANIRSVDTSQAEAMPGVFATMTAAEMAQQCDPFFRIAPDPAARIEEYPLALKARYQGDAVAMVMAETRELARDAAELIEVDYEPLPAVVDAVEAADPRSPMLHEEVGSNIAWRGVYDYGDIDWALEHADHVVRIERLHFHRFSSTPLECQAALVNWDPGTGNVEIHSNIQFPMFASQVMGPSLGIRQDQLLWRYQDSGGGFGNKIAMYPQVAALALISRKAGRPAKWTEYRTESMLSGGMGNERTFLDVEIPAMSDGTILGFKLRAFDDAGAYLHYEPLGAVIWSQVVPGCYRFKHVRVDYTETLTNKCPTVPNRGYSRLQHLWMIERLVDTVARQLEFDPIELRKRNYVQPEDYPYETPNGCVYDSGDLPRTLDKALALIDYAGALERQRAASGNGSGKRIGIGIGSTLDSGTNNFGQARIINPELPFSGNGEAATVKLDLYGEIYCTLGSSPTGQGHETTTAQVVADILGVDPDDVRVNAGFNKEHSAYVGFSGTYASQFAVTGINAAIGAARKLRSEIITIAAAALTCEESDIVLEAGVASYQGDAERAIPLIGVANLVFANNAALSPEIIDSVTLNCRYVYRPPFQVPDPVAKRGNLTLTYAVQIHACVVELDEETGQVRILDYGAVDDCGRRINPQIVEGQVHGATAHGIGAALYEAYHYSPEGQLLNANFYDYHAVTALDVPALKTDHVESPSPFTPNGAKGMGEGGGAPLATICSAIQDALGPGAPLVNDTHNPPERVWGLLRGKAASGVEVTSR